MKRAASRIVCVCSTLAVVLFSSASALGASERSATPCTAQTRGDGSTATRDGCERSARALPYPGMRMSNRPSDGRTGGTPETSARVPGGPPDDVNTGLSFAIPSIKVF